ncbi:hypothetical protein ACIGNX_16460 [Actinosynnema sp. NPDC053489]|uniref:hypothetical protein n=1 Tax=Actinosynnema sp. NPDC053489 TaxID=3363916 RepID=UPI0037C9D17E
MDERTPAQSFGPDQPVGHPRSTASSIAILVNVVSVGIGGLYLSTHSVLVTAIGAALVALLVLAAMKFDRVNS